MVTLRFVIVLGLASCAANSPPPTADPPPPLFQELHVVPVVEPLPLDQPNEWAFFTTREVHSLNVTLASRDSRSLTALIEGQGGRGPARVICLFSRDSDDVRCLVQAGRITDSFPPPGYPRVYSDVALQSAEIKLSSLDWQAGSTVGLSFRLVAERGREIRGFVKGNVVGPEPMASSDDSTSVPPLAEASSIPADFQISLWRGECFGACPVYSVRVDASGRVEYEGKQYVAVLGRSSWEVPPSSVASLLAECDEVRFFDLKLRCDVLVYDTPQVVIDVTRDGSTRRLFSDMCGTCDSKLHDDPNVHVKFASFADSIDKLLQTSSRVGLASEEPAKR